MAYDEKLAQRVREVLSAKEVSLQEKPMMGGLCFMVNGKMCVGVEKEKLMVRIDPTIYEAALLRQGCAPMDFTGKPLRGFVFVDSQGTNSRRQLASWIRLALEFNPRAVASKLQRSAAGKTKGGISQRKVNASAAKKSAR